MQHVASPIQTIGQSAVSGTGQVARGGTRETFTLEELAVVLSHFDIGVIESVTEFPRGSRKAPKLLIVSEQGKFLLKRRARGKDDPFKVAFCHAIQLFLASKESCVKLTQMSGWVAARGDVDWSPLLKDIPQYKEFVTPSEGVTFYPEPVMGAWNEIESRLADKLPGAYIDPAMQDPAKLAAFIKAAAAQTDQILKQNDLYGT